MAKLRLQTFAFFLAFLLALAVFALLVNTKGRAAQTTKNVAVLLSRNALPYKAAVAGFSAVLSEKGIDCKTLTFDLDGSYEEGRRVFKDKTIFNADLILAVGTIASEVAFNEEDERPVVFTMVLYPEESGISAGEKVLKDNVAGVSLNISPAVQFNKIRQLMPTVKRIGVIYNPLETNTIIAEAEKAAREAGLSLVPIRVYSSADVPDALKTLRGKIDVLWSVADSTVLGSKSSKYIITYTLRNRIPFVGISSYYVREGALFSLSPDYSDAGRQAGEIASAIFSGTPPAKIAVPFPRKVRLSINLKTAFRVGVKVKSEVLIEAYEVIK